MSDYLNTVRLHLVDRLTFTVLPWCTLLFAFLINFVLFTVLSPPDGKHTGALLTLPCFMFVLGVMTLARSLPFVLALGITRQRFYLGTIATAVVASAAWAVIVVALNLLEPVAGGWGIDLHFFRVPWLLAGPWYQVLLTSFVVLALFFVAGMWAGLIYRRWAVPGLLVMIAAMVVIGTAVALIITARQGWPSIGHFLSGADVYGVTGILAAVAALLGLGGLFTVRTLAV